MVFVLKKKCVSALENFVTFYGKPDRSNVNEVVMVVLKSFYEEFLYAQKSIKSK